MTPQDPRDPRVVDFETFSRRIAGDDRVVPHNLEAERAILGAILLHKETLPQASAILTATDFFRDAHRRIFAAMCALSASQQDIEPVTLRHELGASFEQVGGAAYLTSLVDGMPHGSHIEAHARLVKDQATRRHLIAAATKLLNSAYERDDDTATLITTAQQDLALVADRDPGVGTLPALQTARDLSARPEPSTSDQLLGALIVRGQRHLIGGHTGRGKTSLILGLLKAMLTRTSYLGFEPHENTPKVLMIDAEQGLRTIKRRLNEAGLQDRDDLVYLTVPGGLTLDTSAAERSALEAYLRDGKFDVVVASPLYKLHNGDAKEERAAVDLMKLFDRWRDLYGFASLFEMHCRKPPPLGSHLTMHDFFGSGAYLRGAEIVLGIDRLRPGVSRLYFFKDRDGDLPCGETWPLTFDTLTGFARDLSTKESKPSALAKVAGCLRQSAPHAMTNAAIQQVTTLSERTVRDALKALNAVERHGEKNLKEYTLPPELNLDPDDDDEDPV